MYIKCTVQYSAVQYSSVQYSNFQYSTVQCSTVQCSTVVYSTVISSTVQQRPVVYVVLYRPEEPCSVAAASVTVRPAEGKEATDTTGQRQASPAHRLAYSTSAKLLVPSYQCQAPKAAS